MTDHDKELIQKDMLVIFSLNSKLHYENREEIVKVYTAIAQKKMLQTALGAKYSKRLEEIAKGMNSFCKCVLCERDLDNKTLICNSCLKKYNELQLQKSKILHQEKSNENAGNQVTSIPKQQTDTIKSEEKIRESEQNEKLDNRDNAVKPKNSILRMGLILTMVVAVLWALNAVIGLGNLFAICTLAVMVILVYKCIKKQKKRNTIIAMVVFFLLMGVFDQTGAGRKSDIINMLGKTEEQVWKEWGKPDYVSMELWETYDEGYSYMVSGEKVWWVSLENENKNETLMGISIGDNEDKVNRTMEKAEFTQIDEQVTEYLKINKNYMGNNNGTIIVIMVFLDLTTNTVESVTAIDSAVWYQ